MKQGENNAEKCLNIGRTGRNSG